MFTDWLRSSYNPRFFLRALANDSFFGLQFEFKSKYLGRITQNIRKMTHYTQERTRETTMITGAYNMRDTKTVLEAVLRVKNTHKN